MGIEWQWEGQYEGIHPFCKELFLRAVGKFHTDLDDERYSDDAIAIFNDISTNGGNVSPTSLYGLFQTLQRSGRYHISFDLLRKIMNHTTDDTTWSIISENAENFLQNPSRSSLPVKPLAGMDVVNGKIVASVMLPCMKAGEYGLALMKERIISCTKFGNDMDLSMHFPDEGLWRRDDYIASIIRSDIDAWNSVEYTNVIRDCFQHLKCKGVVDVLKSREIASPEMDDVSLAREYVGVSTSTSVNTSWLEAFTHIHYLSRKLRFLVNENHELDKLQSHHLFQKLARMMDSCTDAGQPKAGMYMTELFAQYWEEKNKPQQRFLSLISETVFGKGESQRSNLLHDRRKTLLDFTALSDALLLATIRAYEKSNGMDDALEFYFEAQENLPNTHSASVAKQGCRINAANFCLSLLVRRGRIDDAISLYNRIPEEERNCETYSLICEAYANSGKWEDVSSFYNFTRDKGFLTETIGLLAMKGIERSVMDGKVRAIRSIASDLAAMSGEESDKWIASRYWTLKKYVGFHYARLLMWWRDPERTQQNELALAIRHLKEHNLRQVSINNEALRVVVKFIAKRYSETNEEQDRRFAVETILESLKVADKTILAADSVFQSEAALVLQQLQEFGESYKILISAIDRGLEIDSQVIDMVMAKYNLHNVGKR